jgi:hypothetical protein
VAKRWRIGQYSWTLDYRTSRRFRPILIDKDSRAITSNLAKSSKKLLTDYRFDNLL